MGADNNEQVKVEGSPAETANNEQELIPGIYLELKKGMLGTGNTAKPTEFKNFWVTLKIEAAKVVMILLDDEFRPTAIKETFSIDTIRGAGWHYVEAGVKRYGLLKDYLERQAAAQSAAKAKKKAAPSGEKTGWWSK